MVYFWYIYWCIILLSCSIVSNYSENLIQNIKKEKRRMKKKLNKFIATLTVCEMSLSCINVYATQDNAQTIKGTFIFGAHSSDTDMTDSYEYSDSYFNKSGYEENTNLAIMSMRMAAASISSSDVDYSEKSKNVQNLLEQIGFNEVEVNEYYKQKMDFNTMGAAVAYKVIGDTRKNRLSYWKICI